MESKQLEYVRAVCKCSVKKLFNRRMSFSSNVRCSIVKMPLFSWSIINRNYCSSAFIVSTMADFKVDMSRLPEDVREKLAELDLELSEGERRFSFCLSIRVVQSNRISALTNCAMSLINNTVVMTFSLCFDTVLHRQIHLFRMIFCVTRNHECGLLGWNFRRRVRTIVSSIDYSKNGGCWKNR